MWDYFLARRNGLLECCCHREVPRQTAETSRSHCSCLIMWWDALSFPIVWCVHCLCVSQHRQVRYTATFRYHSQTERASSLDSLLSLLLSPRQHMKLLTLVSRVLENDIQLTEISLLHRRHRQSGLIAEIDASCPRPPSKHIHPPPQSHFSMKQQLSPNRYS